MAEYITREAALTAVDETYLEYLAVVQAAVRNIPAADVAPVRHGRWLWNALAKPFCSECGVETWIASNFALPNYCQHCGARMDGAK